MMMMVIMMRPKNRGHRRFIIIVIILIIVIIVPPCSLCGKCKHEAFTLSSINMKYAHTTNKVIIIIIATAKFTSVIS